jgi:hypothetical protein
MDYYLDTEFAERPCTIDLISIGLVREDGTAFYRESSEVNEDLCNDWVKANVLPKRTVSRHNRSLRSHIKNDILAFIGDDTPRFWGYFADYDWVVFCWLFGAMIDLPKHWPMFCLDLKQELNRLKIPKEALTPPDPAFEHHALADAQWTMRVHRTLLDGAQRYPQDERWKGML